MVTTTAPIAPPVIEDKWNLGEGPAYVVSRLGFEPTGKEQAAILRCRKRFKLVVGGGQAGKSLTASVDFIIHLFEDMAKYPEGTLRYWLLAADYARTKAEFDYITGFLDKVLRMPGVRVDPDKRVDPGEITVTYKGEKAPRIIVETKSGKDPRTLAMFGPHGIIGCEASQLDLDTYFKAQERLSSKNGWLHLAGTYESSLGWYPGLAKAWAHGSQQEQSFILPSPSNFHAYPGGLENETLKRLKADTSDQFFMERIMGVAAPPRGIVFTEFRADIHIREVKYDPELPIVICHDPGYGHANAIEVFQVAKGGQIRVIDEIYERGLITADLINTLMKRDYWKNPQKTLVVDPNYVFQHHSGPSMADVWMTNAQLVAFGVKVKVAEGIERLKSFLKVDAITGEPGIVWHPKCKGVLSELGAYPNPFDNQTHVYSYKLDSEGNVVGEDPDPRWNDGISAIAYGIVERFGLSGTGAATEFVVTTYGAQPRRSRRLYGESRRNRRSGYVGLLREVRDG